MSALALRVPELLRAKPEASAGPCDGDQLGLAFDAPGGPLVGVCGLCGGAGASTLAYLLAAAAARQSRGPVLALDAHGHTAGLSLYARMHSRLSLAGAANLVAAGRRPPGLSARSPDGVRVLASGTLADEPADPDGTRRLLADARAAHGLTVADCGTLGCLTARTVAPECSHLLWVLPASPSAIERGAQLLAHRSPALHAPACLVARLDRHQPKASLPALAELADAHGATLVLHPHIADLHESPVEQAIVDAQLALQAIAGVLAR